MGSVENLQTEMCLKDSEKQEPSPIVIAMGRVLHAIRLDRDTRYFLWFLAVGRGCVPEIHVFCNAPVRAEFKRMAITRMTLAQGWHEHVVTLHFVCMVAKISF